eukprot:COSAG01_NODE_3538_length_5959_cov_660.412116_5_plen_160_part_00
MCECECVCVCVCVCVDVLTPPPPTRSDDAPQGQRYNRHADAYQPLSDRGKRAMGFSGNRIITALFYLSPVARGGSTGFANLKFEVTPKIGKLLVFHNCYEGSCQVRTPPPPPPPPPPAAEMRRRACRSSSTSAVFPQMSDRWLWHSHRFIPTPSTRACR